MATAFLVLTVFATVVDKHGRHSESGLKVFPRAVFPCALCPAAAGHMAFGSFVAAAAGQATSASASRQATADRWCLRGRVVHAMQVTLPAPFAPLAIGLAVVVGAFAAGPFTGGAMNPARALGPAIAFWNFKNIWVYLLANFMGGMSGAVIYENLFLEVCPHNSPPPWVASGSWRQLLGSMMGLRSCATSGRQGEGVGGRRVRREGGSARWVG